MMTALPSQPTPTSEAAAEYMAPRAGSARARVLDVIRLAGLAGLTDEEQQDALLMNPSTQRPRRGELVAAGLVVDSGRERPTRSGCKAVVWVAREHLTGPGSARSVGSRLGMEKHP